MNKFFNVYKTAGASLTSSLNKSLVLLGLVYLIVFSSYVEGLVNPILLSILLLIYLLTRSKGNLGIEIPTLVFFLVLILTSITSIDPRRSFYEVCLIGIGIFLIYFTARIVQLGFSPRTIINFLLLIGLGFMIFSWLDAGRWYMTWRSSYPDELIPGISFRLNGGNTIAAYYHGILMIGIARFVYSRSRIERLVLGAYCLSVGLLIFLSSSRGAYLGVMGGLFILVVLQWGKLRKWMPLLRNLFTRFRVPILAVGLIALLAIATFGYWYLQNMQSHPTHGAALQSRNAFWGPAWEAFLRSLWIGNGLYTFASEYMYSISVPPSPIFLHAHSTYLDILSGIGLIGALAFGWLIATLFLLLWHQSRDANANHPEINIGALLVLTSFLIHSIFDGLYLMSFASFNLCLLIGSALGNRRKTKRKFSWIPIGLGMVVVALAWMNLWLTTPYRDGLAAASANDFELAAEQFAVSVSRDPGLVLTHQQLGLVESILASEGDQAALDRAIKAMQETVRLDPAYSPNHANLGALYREQGELELAIETFKYAIQLAPDWGIWHLNLGETYEMQKHWELAAQSYENALSLEPSSVGDGFWAKTSFRSEFYANWQVKNLDLEEDDVTYTVDEVTHQTVAVPILKLAAQKVREEDFQTAKKLLGIAGLAHFRRFAEPLELVWLRAEVMASSENWSEAIALGEEALDGFRLQGAYGPGGAGKTLYGTGIFRRNMMEVELVPQLTLIRLPEPWPERMLKLASWYKVVQDLTGCEATMDELLQKIPDFWQRYPDQELDCRSKR